VGNGVVQHLPVFFLDLEVLGNPGFIQFPEGGFVSWFEGAERYGRQGCHESNLDKIDQNVQYIVYQDQDDLPMNQNIDLRHLRYFLAVAEELHFGRAAQRLHIAQPPLSQQIRRLEQEIGFPLFLRSSRSVKLTPAGKSLVDRARRTLRKVDEDLEAVRSVARGEVGLLRVGFVGSSMLTRLPSILRKYRRMYESVQLHLDEIHTSQIIEALREGSIDVALARDAGTPEGLQVEPVLVEPLLAVVPSKHPLASRRLIPIAQLKDEPFVFFPRSAGSYAWENTIRLCEQQGFRPNIVQEAPQWLTVVRLVGAGLGVTIMPASVEKIAAPDVVCRKLAPDGGTTSIDLVYRQQETNPLVKAFCGMF
jgi:DNA-binding transcriptional LysR family regulator